MFVLTERETVSVAFSTDADPDLLNPEQRATYNTVLLHLREDSPIRMFVNGTAGSGEK